MSNVVKFKRPRKQQAERLPQRPALPPALLGWTVLLTLAALITLFRSVG